MRTEGKNLINRPVDADAEFSLPGDRVWLNASHQGPLPDRAAAAVAEMVRWKQQPHHLITPAPFTETPARLRSVLAELLAAPTEELVLANSSSYGVHLVANGLEFLPGDEVLVASNDFPSDVLPWTRLRGTGVVVKLLKPEEQVLTAAEIASEMSSRTRVVCLTWVHSLSGHMVDLDAIGELCRKNNVLFVVNGSQGVGGIPISVGDHPIDVLTSVGFKYLCGPYGTGFCWLSQRALDRVAAAKLYWLSALTADDLAAESLDLESIQPPEDASRHDVFGTANFFNFASLAESAGLIAETGVERIYAHNLSLSERFTASVDQSRFEIQHRGDVNRRSAILFLKPLTCGLEEASRKLTEAGIDVVRRRGMVRVSPHFYNSYDDIDRAVAAFNEI